MQQWEYKVFKYAESLLIYSISHVDELGKKGWELIAVTCNSNNEYHYFFKRPVS